MQAHSRSTTLIFIIAYFLLMAYDLDAAIPHIAAHSWYTLALVLTYPLSHSLMIVPMFTLFNSKGY